MFVNSLKIENFKSIEELNIKPARVNVFIGEPNSGKTNIIEALAFLSQGFLKDRNYKEMVRFEDASDLFPNFDMTKTIRVITSQLYYTIGYAKMNDGTLTNKFLIEYFNGINNPNVHKNLSSPELRYDGTIAGGVYFSTPFCYYIFKPLKNNLPDLEPFLDVPFGQNIPNLLKTNPSLFDLVDEIFADNNFRLYLRPSDNKIEMAKEVKRRLYGFKFTNISTTLQKIIFMLLAIKSNKEKILIFDEPESNTYPFYTQEIAKYIADDKSNQYFMTSHSPYLINKLIDKTPLADLNIYLAKMKDFRTEIKLLNKQQVEDFSSMGEDAILNLDNLAA